MDLVYRIKRLFTTLSIKLSNRMPAAKQPLLDREWADTVLI